MSAPAQNAVAQSALQKFWNHPAGMDPIITSLSKEPRKIGSAGTLSEIGRNWGLVIAGLKDLNRPVETLSVPQTTALAATGVIWSRYATVITPINYNLMSVNIFVGATGLYQLYRIWELSAVLFLAIMSMHECYENKKKAGAIKSE
ncbi:hypothetical protein HDU98_000247 [Podochytrium sp. JEL0797]|nr:hypothetical protein HDU98_000247 [Podochytrium sp. JEL0797]